MPDSRREQAIKNLLELSPGMTRVEAEAILNDSTTAIERRFLEGSESSGPLPEGLIKPKEEPPIASSIDWSKPPRYISIGGGIAPMSDMLLEDVSVLPKVRRYPLVPEPPYSISAVFPRNMDYILKPEDLAEEPTGIEPRTFIMDRPTFERTALDRWAKQRGEEILKPPTFANIQRCVECPSQASESVRDGKDGVLYFMCEYHANHAVTNRGFERLNTPVTPVMLNAVVPTIAFNTEANWDDMTEPTRRAIEDVARRVADLQLKEEAKLFYGMEPFYGFGPPPNVDGLLTQVVGFTPTPADKALSSVTIPESDFLLYGNLCAVAEAIRMKSEMQSIDHLMKSLWDGFKVAPDVMYMSSDNPLLPRMIRRAGRKQRALTRDKGVRDRARRQRATRKHRK